METEADVFLSPDGGDSIADRAAPDDTPGGDSVSEMDTALEVEPAPVVVSTLAGTPVDVAISGSMAAVALGMGGIGILDLSKAPCGEWVGYVALGEECTLVAVHGTTAFALSGERTISAVDLQVPSNPVVVSSVVLDDHRVKALLVSKDRLFVLASRMVAPYRMVLLSFDASQADSISGQWDELRSDNKWIETPHNINSNGFWDMASSPNGDRIYVCSVVLSVYDVGDKGDLDLAELYDSSSASGDVCLSVMAGDDLVIVSYLASPSRLELLQPDPQLKLLASLDRDEVNMDLALGSDSLLSVDFKIPSAPDYPVQSPPPTLTRFAVEDLLSGQAEPNLALQLGEAVVWPKLALVGDMALLARGDWLDIFSFGMPAGLTCTMVF